MNVHRFFFVNYLGNPSTESRIKAPDGDYVLYTDYAALEARCAGLEEALRWYADDGNYRYLDRDDLPILHDSGDRARAALADTTTDEVQP